MQVTYLGHSTFQIQTNGFHLLFDPFITPNQKANRIDASAVKADFILLTHGHQDHMADAEQIAKNNNSTIVSNYEIVSWYGQKGINGFPLNHGGQKKFEFGMVKFVNAVHSSVLPDGTYGGNPGGFVVWNAETCFYVAGDTALTMDMKLIPMTCPKLDFAILPIGDNFTMGYEDAIIASEFIDCETIIGCHYDTFGFIEIDHQAAQKAFSDKGKKLMLLEIGETIEV